MLYNKTKEGTAITIKIIVGMIVHTISNVA
jgi:hypothetical protein